MPQIIIKTCSAVLKLSLKKQKCNKFTENDHSAKQSVVYRPAFILKLII